MLYEVITEGAGNAVYPRQGYRDGLSGSDDIAEPDDDGRTPDYRGADQTSEHDSTGSEAPGNRDAWDGRHPPSGIAVLAIV